MFPNGNFSIGKFMCLICIVIVSVNGCIEIKQNILKIFSEKCNVLSDISLHIYKWFPGGGCPRTPLQASGTYRPRRVHKIPPTVCLFSRNIKIFSGNFSYGKFMCLIVIVILSSCGYILIKTIKILAYILSKYSTFAPFTCIF